jgi:hypothetical protein
MFYFLYRYRGRHGPLVRAASGVALVAAGLFIFTRILLSVGGLLILWGIAGWISRWRGRDDDSSPGGTPGR